MSDKMNEDFVLQLANLPGGDGKKGPRRVATPEGAAFYGQPIGTIITADMIEQAKKAKGEAPKGALAPVKQGGSGGNSNAGNVNVGAGQQSAGAGQTSAAPGAQGGSGQPVTSAGNIHTAQGYQAPGIDSTPPDWVTNPPEKPAAPQMALGIKESGLNGPKKFTVGGSSYNAPEGSRFIKPKSGAEMAIIITPDEEIHFFTAKGEVEADDTIKQVLKDRFGKKVKPDDTLYGEEEFEAEDGLENMQVGQHLHDAEGNKIFTKSETGFIHSELGIPVDEKDVKPLFDSGELTTKPKKVAEEEVTGFDYGEDDENEISFASMTPEEFQDYLSTLDQGDKLYIVGGVSGKSGLSEYNEVTKVGDNVWITDNGGKVTSNGLGYAKKSIRTIEPKDLQKAGTYKAEQDKLQAEKDEKKAVSDAAAAEKAAVKKAKDDEQAAFIAQKQKDAQIEVEKEKAAKRAAASLKGKKEQKVVDQAIAESDAIFDAESKLTSYQSDKLEAQKLGTHPGPIFKTHALPGSQVWLSDDDTTWELQVSDGPVKKWKLLGGKQTLDTSSLFGTGTDVYVAKNTMNGDETWTAANLDSDDSVGSVPTSNFIYKNGPANMPGDQIENTVTGGVYHRTSDGRWVHPSNPNGKMDWAGLVDEAFQGKLKVKHLSKADDGTFVIGDQIKGETIENAFLDDAAPGATLGYYKSPLSLNAEFNVTLNDQGVWQGDKPFVGDSFVLPVVDSIPGTYYVKSMGEGSVPEKPLEIPVPEPKKAGDVASYEDIVAAPVGTKFKYTKMDGSQSDYSKLDEDTILMPQGVQQPIHHWKKSVDAGKVSFADDEAEQSVDLGLPEPLVAPTGDPVEDKKSFDDFINDITEAELDLDDLDFSEEDALYGHVPDEDESGFADSSDLTVEELELAPEGTQVTVPQYESGDDDEEKTAADETFEVYTKGDDGYWYEAGDDSPWATDELEAIAIGPIAMYGETKQPAVVSVEDLEALPVGSKVDVGNLGFTKADNGYWYEDEVDDGGLWASEDLESALNDNQKITIVSFPASSSFGTKAAYDPKNVQYDPDMLDSYPVGTTIGWGQNDVYWTKSETNGWWISPDGTTKNSAQSMSSGYSNLHAAKLPENDTPTMADLVAPNKSFLDSLPDGTWVTVPYGANHSEEYQKLDGEWWINGDSFDSDEMTGFAAGKIVMSGGPEKSTAEIVADLQKPNISLLTPDDGSFNVSEEHVWGAIDALQNHSHGSPVYGLKSLPDGNPIKEKQKGIIEYAQTLWPKHKPKAAVLAYLKSKVTVSDNVADLTEQDDPTLHLGSEKPVKNQFGITGGDFKQSEIEKAIKIIEGYDGKLYKGQLTTAGNPLGTLDFNTLVGANKDKLEQKKQVIEHLKKQVNHLASPKVTTVEDVTGAKAANPFGGQFLNGKPGHWEMTNPEEANNLPVGSMISPDEGESVYELVDPGNGTLKYSSVDFPEDGWFDADDIEQSDTVLQKWSIDDVPGLKNLYSADLAALPGGTKIAHINNNVNVLTKTGTEWQQDSGYQFSPYMISIEADKGKIYLHSIPEDGAKQDKKITDFDEFKGLPIGSKIDIVTKFNTSHFTKVTSDQWEEGNGSIAATKAFEFSIGKGRVFLISKPNETDENFIAPPAVQSKFNDEGEGPLEQHAHSYLPGYYEADSGDSVSVFTDGTGVTTDEDGAIKSLTPEEVSKLGLDKNWWKFNGVQNTGSASKAKFIPKKAAVTTNPTTKFDPKQLADGNYYVGDPTNPDTPVWNLHAGVATMYTAEGSTVITPVKLKNAVLKGELTDKWGNSAALPENHVGPVKFMGVTTNSESLKALRLALMNDELQLGVSNTHTILASFGVYGKNGNLESYINSTHGSLASDNFKPAITNAIDDMLGDPADYPGKKFEEESPDFAWYEGTGKAQFPIEAALVIENKYSYQKKVTEANKAIQAASVGIGDGKTIGQHVSGLSLADKRVWLKAFMEGDFKKMYDLEVKGAIKQGVSHSAGWKHPGYPANTLTHKINWGPSVPGEMTVDDVVPGKWSDLTLVTASETDNYLISAGMQYPSFLSKADRWTWVYAHRTKDSFTVNNLSAKARQKFLSGENVLTPAPLWNDDIKPAASYDKFFQSGPYPVTEWLSADSVKAAGDFIGDIQNNKVKVLDPSGKQLTYEDFKPFWDDAKMESPYANITSLYRISVSNFFADLLEKKDAIDSKPVYSLAPTQTIKQSKHPAYNVVDQHGKKYIFKNAAPDVNGEKYRAEVEAVANDISAFFGQKTPSISVTTFQGKLGTMQEEVTNIKSLNGFSWSTADKMQTVDLANEHLSDWMLDQDDNWAPNTLVTPDGHLVGIDKGRSFANYGSWDGMRSDAGMDVNTHLVYSDMYQAIINKQISKETADATWFAAKRRAAKIAKADEGTLLEMLHKATDSRTDWKIDYKIDGKKVPQTQQGFFDAFLDRKAKLPEQVEALWKGIYEKAGYGELPEPPKAALGEGQHSGLDDSNLHTTALTVGSVGTSTLVASPSVIGGTATLWGHKNSDGSKDMNAQMYLAPKKEKDVLSWFKSNSDASKLSKENANPGEFTNDDKYVPFVAAAKTIGAHAEDGQYNAGTLEVYENAKKDLAADSAFWEPGMVPSDGKDFIEFPSGAKVPFGQVDQYKMMLDYYSSKVSIIDEAKDSKTKPSQTINKFEAIDLHDSNVVYLDGNGQKLVKLANGKWIYVSSNLMAVIENAEATKLYEGEGSTWTKWKDEPESAKVIFKAVLGSTHEKQGTFSDFELSLSGKHLSGGNNGNEYEVTLPTGEKIYFRDSDDTNTVRGQKGRITVRVPSAKNEDDVSNGMANAQAWLDENLGLGLDAADQDSAELIYWREMYTVLVNRKHTAGSKWAKAKKDLDAKVTEVGGNANHFLETFAEKATVDEQNQFFRNLWGTHFGKDKVDKLISSEGYLPYYEQHDLRHLDLNTGKPQWQRFDVDLSELKAKNMMLASRARSGDHVLSAVKSGGAYSTEERSRLFGQWVTGMSSGADQSYGSSNSVFTRVFSDTTHSGLSFIYNPRALLRTRSYSFPGDNFGSLDNRKSSSPSNPVEAWMSFAGGSNETMIPHAAGLFGDLEIVVFDDAKLLNEAIQEMKKLGISKIRGVPIEDRLVMRNKLSAAVQKLKETWYK